MTKLQDVVQIKPDQPKSGKPSTTTKAFQMRLSENKSLVVYNYVNGYILDALLKAVFSDVN
ncbi:hypothetical protein DIS16_10860 [Levilactobacillus brevis]|uniref:hypothetical protein n=1 Tax=Levilactobacillus brevis TaxID=1580 RepID=UPI0011216B48|nr:hypothetical protein [Levilactobacillus brevis]TOY74930.1 hypothetical protein DIS16_10860 [Levilactobacillus brevis]